MSPGDALDGTDILLHCSVAVDSTHSLPRESRALGLSLAAKTHHPLQVEEAVFLADHMYIRPGASVFEPGDEDENCYVVLSGVIEEVYSGYLAGGPGEEKVMSPRFVLRVHTQHQKRDLSVLRRGAPILIVIDRPAMCLLSIKNQGPSKVYTESELNYYENGGTSFETTSVRCIPLSVLSALHLHRYFEALYYSCRMYVPGCGISACHSLFLRQPPSNRPAKCVL